MPKQKPINARWSTSIKKNDFHLKAAHENTKLYHFLINWKDIMIYCYLMKLYIVK